MDAQDDAIRAANAAIGIGLSIIEARAGGCRQPAGQLADFAIIAEGDVSAFETLAAVHEYRMRPVHNDIGNPLSPQQCIKRAHSGGVLAQAA